MCLFSIVSGWISKNSMWHILYPQTNGTADYSYFQSSHAHVLPGLNFTEAFPGLDGKTFPSKAHLAGFRWYSFVHPLPRSHLSLFWTPHHFCGTSLMVSITFYFVFSLNGLSVLFRLSVFSVAYKVHLLVI